jgi:hypothetical protein
MEAHPLRGAVRFPIYPLMAICAGCLSGLLADLYEMTGMYTWTSIGVAVGGAIGFGLSLSARCWVGLLIGPPLGALGVAAARVTVSGVEWTWSEAPAILLHAYQKDPGMLVVGFLMAAPLVGLHTLPGPGGTPRPPAWLVYAASAGLLWLLWFLGGGRFQAAFLGFLLLFNLGSRAAWDWALKLSATQLGSPSSRVDSS